MDITHLINLISDPWIPVIRADGCAESIAPWQVTTHYGTNPIVAINAVRPDFQGALIQFLIGLCQTCITPDGMISWKSTFQKPPDSLQLSESFSAVADFFNVAGDGPLFMQDRTVECRDPKPIDSLLIEMPGENTVNKNTDFFLKRDTVSRICPVCAATALYTLQTNGPSGGKGHRTGLRGGGPLTTIILGTTLWETIWLNVLDSNSFYRDFEYERKDAPEDIFPWAGDIRTSEGDRTTGVRDVSLLQMYWGMGRRILFNASSQQSGTCDICGVSDHLYDSYYTRPYGVNYDETWHHCLSPYYGKANDELLPVHCQPGGIQYNHWIGIFQEESSEKSIRRPAAVVTTFLDSRAKLLKESYQGRMRIWAFGFDMDNMKARCWYEGQLPVYLMDDEILQRFEVQVEQIVKSAEYILGILSGCIRDALYGAKSKKSEPSVVKSRFWRDTEPYFYAALDALSSMALHPESSDEVKRGWLLKVQKISLALFDEYAQVEYLTELNPAQIIGARMKFIRNVNAKSPKISKILGLLAPAQEK